MKFSWPWTARFDRLDQVTAAILAELTDLKAAQAKGFLDMSTTTTQLDTDIAADQVDLAALVTAVNSIVAFMGTVPTLITNAVNTALANGATPAQLAEVTAIGTSVATETASLSAALAAATAATTPTVAGGTSTTGGGAA